MTQVDIDLRKARARRYYDAKKLRQVIALVDLLDTELTLVAKRYEIDRQLGELRQKVKSHIPIVTPEGKRKLGQSKAIVGDLIKQYSTDPELLLMVSQDLRAAMLTSGGVDKEKTN